MQVLHVGSQEPLPPEHISPYFVKPLKHVPHTVPLVQSAQPGGQFTQDLLGSSAYFPVGHTETQVFAFKYVKY